MVLSRRHRRAMLPEFWRTPRLGPNFYSIKCRGVEGVVRHLNLAKRSDQILVMCFGEKIEEKLLLNLAKRSDQILVMCFGEKIEDKLLLTYTWSFAHFPKLTATLNWVPFSVLESPLMTSVLEHSLQRWTDIRSRYPNPTGFLPSDNTLLCWTWVPDI